VAKYCKGGGDRFLVLGFVEARFRFEDWYRADIEFEFW